jgi:hypothetical protein
MRLLTAWQLGPGKSVCLAIDDAKTAKWRLCMDVLAKIKDAMTDINIRGYQDGCAILIRRDHIAPWGSRLYLKPEQAKTLGLPFQRTGYTDLRRS